MHEQKRKCFMCDKSPADNPGLLLYRFPKPGNMNILRAEAWAKFCFPLGDWHSAEFQMKLYNEHRMLCDRHFSKESFIEYASKKLSRHASPVKNYKKIVPVLRHINDPTGGASTEKEHNNDSSGPYQNANNKETETKETNVGIDTPSCPPDAVTQEDPTSDASAKFSAEFGELTEKLPDSHEPPQIETQEQCGFEVDPIPENAQKEDHSFTVDITKEEVKMPVEDLTMYEEEPEVEDQKDTGLVEDDLHVGLMCNVCDSDIRGFRYVCVECTDWDMCGSCEARGAHRQHYVLRLPGPRPQNEIQNVLDRIRRELLDLSVFIENSSVKNEDDDEDQGPDPLYSVIGSTEYVNETGDSFAAESVINEEHLNKTMFSESAVMDTEDFDDNATSIDSSENSDSEQTSVTFRKRTNVSTGECEWNYVSSKVDSVKGERTNVISEKNNVSTCEMTNVKIEQNMVSTTEKMNIQSDQNNVSTDEISNVKSEQNKVLRSERKQYFKKPQLIKIKGSGSSKTGILKTLHMGNKPVILKIAPQQLKRLKDTIPNLAIQSTSKNTINLNPKIKIEKLNILPKIKITTKPSNVQT